VIEGLIHVNNRKPDMTTRHNTAYILQDDFHMACLTVKETLTYAVRLRCGLEHYSKEETDRVSTLISLLGLTVCQNVIVGNQLVKGISGGQLRRLSIGVEVVLLPDLVCLDGG
jgi:ABC-type multidrug transport system ATPase subunit